MTTQSALVDSSKSEGPDLADLPWVIYSSDILLTRRQEGILHSLTFYSSIDKSWEQIHLCCLKIWSSKTSVLPCAGLARTKENEQAAFLT